MFWIILVVAFMALGIFLTVMQNEEFYTGVFTLVALLTVLLGVFFSFPNKEEVIFQYEEQLGAQATELFSDNEFIFTLHDGSHKIATFNNVKIEKANGDYFVKYTYFRKYREKDFFHFDNEDFDYKLEITKR